MPTNYRNKIPKIGWEGIFDGIEYATIAAFNTPWPKTDAGAICTQTLDLTVFSEGAQALKCSLNNVSGSNKDVLFTRAVTGLLKSQLYNFRGRVKLNAALTGGTTGIECTGGTTSYVANGTTATWQDLACTGTSDASGNLTILMVMRAIPTATTLFLDFDDLRLELDLLCPIWLDSAVAHTVPREGSVVAQSLGGAEDAWILGHDQTLEGMIRFIPRDAATGVTGWNDLNAAGQSVGWYGFLEWARSRNIFRFYQDAAGAPLVYVPSYLVEPWNTTPTLESLSSMERSLPIKFRSANGARYLGY
jgi:hypothetical protein